jgi:hypothetical protein
MSVYDKRVTRDMRQSMLKIHNDLRRITNPVDITILTGYFPRM